MVWNSLKEDLLHHVGSSQQEHLLKVSYQGSEEDRALKDANHFLEGLTNENVGVLFIILLAIRHLKQEEIVV